MLKLETREKGCQRLVGHRVVQPRQRGSAAACEPLCSYGRIDHALLNFFTLCTMKGQKRKKISPSAYNKRTYRRVVAADDMVSSFVTVKETDLHILAAKNIQEEGYHFVHHYRNQLENYIRKHPEFLTALIPLEQDPLAPPIIKAMFKAAAAADVGPMAAVAGAIAEYVGRDLLDTGLQEVMVENGGDIFLKRNRECVAAIFAGQSPLNGKVGIRIPAGLMPAGLCTS